MIDKKLGNREQIIVAKDVIYGEKNCILVITASWKFCLTKTTRSI